MTTRQWIGQFPNSVGASAWSPAGVPGSGDVAVIDGRTIETGGVFPSFVTYEINGGPSGTSGAAMRVSNASFSVGDRIILTSSSYGSVTLEADGPVTNQGLIAFREVPGGPGQPTGTLDLLGGSGYAGVFSNTSVIEFSARTVTVLGSGTLQNNGSIVLSHPDGEAAAATLGDFEVPITGTGTVHVGGGTVADFNAAVGAGQVVTFEPTGSAGSTALVEKPGSFLGVFADFAAGSTIKVYTPNYDGTTASTANGVTTFSFTQGGMAVASLRFQGSYSADQFALSATSYPSTSQVVTITTTVSAGSGGSGGGGGGDVPGLPVYRFFDTRLGTHFFTADTAEVGLIARTRPDLTPEGIGLRAVNPVADDPNAVPVYRFFDSSTGTHFFTASAAEKDSILSTRPDLVFEPSSSFNEHASQQAGDVAVYRFFDNVHGTHFFTASATEQASIVATRADLVSEGIGFYAPGS